MKESTEKALRHATQLLEQLAEKITPAGFKYHSEHTWLGMTHGGDIVTVFVFPDKDKHPSVRIYRVAYVRILTASADGSGLVEMPMFDETGDVDVVLARTDVPKPKKKGTKKNG